MPFAEVRSATFVSLVVAIMVLVFTNRSFSSSVKTVLVEPNPTLWWGLGVAAAALGLMLSLPGLRAFLTFGPLHADDLIVLAGVAAALLSALQILKRAWRSRLRA
jgi:Ca2+-transporting ATPase